MNNKRQRDIQKYCDCNCEPRCCTLPSIDKDVEDCSSIHSSCTGENCKCKDIEKTVEFESDMDLTIH